ncbi:MBL fold metallo-hydrolase RNA specificity domain-containing protein [Anaerotignum faecicola]|uniref:MBL fold metallo-hydrolase RNA specificity domain-containing protein n=1 Tax=Anaerotignum faecicola TaxID=2358141 RepID=UPI003FD8F62B
MKLMFLGADHEVTGSCHYIEACGKSILLDCGMEQGRDTYENQEIPVAAGRIDYVFLSHAHIDHSGLLPLLHKSGFQGQIYATEATTDLCRIMLLDSAHIQEFEAQWRNRKNKRAGKAPFEPLYTTEDAMAVMEHFVPCDYMKEIEVCEGVKIRFTDVGHLLGSSSIEIWLTENGVSKKIVFSGDIGNINQPIIHDPRYTTEADFVIMESTYGDRYHTVPPDYVAELAGQIQQTFDRGGNLVIPSFAVGRTQEMLYFIREIKERRLVHGHDGFKVYVDSPLAIEATRVFAENYLGCYDTDAMALVQKGINPLTFQGLEVAVTPDDSMAINFDKSPKVIISASGMCEAGRIRHHLKHNLWRPECTILFVGYQAIGTLGRNIIEGEKEVRLFGETITVNAHIEELAGVSGHADKKGLLNWVNHFEKKPERVFVVHGEDLVCEDFTKCLKEEYGYNAFAPYSGACFDLAANQMISEGVKIPVAPKELPRGHAASEGGKRAMYLANQLDLANKRLQQIINLNKGGTNRDMEKMLKQINDLCDKLDG